MIVRNDLTATEYNPYYSDYLAKIPGETSIKEALESGLEQSVALVNSLSQDLGHRYMPSKWTLGQVILHCVDTERVFAYRALRFMRGDRTALSGFDQDIFTQDFNDYAFAKAELLKALKTTRQATIQLFNEVDDSFLKRSGIANGNEMTARAIPFIIAGHHAHHERIITERYLT